MLVLLLLSLTTHPQEGALKVDFQRGEGGERKGEGPRGEAIEKITNSVNPITPNDNNNNISNIIISVIAADQLCCRLKTNIS